MTAERDIPPPLFGPDVDRDPAAACRFLRDHAPALRMPLPGGAFAWMVSRYEDATAILADPRFAKDPSLGSAEFRSSGMGLPFDHRPSLGRHMTNADPPDHARLRSAVAGAFSPARMRRLRPRAQEITDRLLDAVVAAGSADLIRDLAFPLPITIICDLLGIPEAERAPLPEWLAVLDASGPETSPSDLLAVTDAVDGFLRRVVAARRATPGDDLITDLLARQDAGTLSADEVTSTVFLLVVGGQETTVALIGNALLRLVESPDLLETIRYELELPEPGPDPVVAVVEESLRLDPPFRNATWRFPTEPITVAGETLQPGDPVLVGLLAANRDPSTFDEPDSFAPGRTGRHIAFGLGAHVCLGAALARMEGHVAISSTVRRLPGLRLQVPAETLAWWPSPIMRGLHALPVTWS